MRKLYVLFAILSITFWSCEEDEMKMTAKDPDTAEEVSVDRFSAESGTLMVRDATNGLPATNAAVDFDQPPFITEGFGPNGEVVEYYNFDVQATDPEHIYVCFNNGAPVSGQLNIIDVLPGEDDYNDFWQVVKVIVPGDYVVNSLASSDDVAASGYTLEVTDMIVNCPVVPKGSTATKRLGSESPALTRGWYKGKVVFYFSFEEKALALTGSSMVPLSPIFVTFNINPPAGGPPSGFVVEAGTMMTHNVLATLPSSGSYSPLWTVNIYDNVDFASVMSLTSAQSANILVTGAANVNCPVVAIQ
ncbi:MAG: hypothetical protein SH857_06140 [Chitinophagales bacterium]|nr:hypothetical protein [Chitinophagales bacterium]